ncbi:MAG: hypothetical protein HYX94_10775 [Chloroflexi bacterium]|nr:hypothetical protein [Chloroflexota bacterium]
MPGKKKVAILQHDADNAELSRLLLEPIGYEVEIVDRKADPLVAIEACSPDVLVVDLRPHVDYYWGILERLAQNPVTAQLPVVAIATLDSVAQRALGQTNVAEVLVAPFDIEELVSKVVAAIGLAQSRWRRQDTEALGA